METEKEEKLIVNRPVQKLYWSIGEVAKELGIAPSKIRFWLQEFKFGEVHRSTRLTRCFTEKDIFNLKLIYDLVEVQGFQGWKAQQIFRGYKI